MGDNDFTAGDPWGLPIEDSEESEIEIARPEEEPHHEVGSGPEDETEPEDDYVPEPGLEGGFDLGEGGDEDEAWSPTPEDVQPLAISDEVDQEEVHEAEEAISEGEEDEYTFKAPSRTPLSQMIAAAQSVIDSVQGDASEDVGEELSQEEEPPVADEAPTEEVHLSDLIEAEPIGVAADSTPGQTAVDDDLPEEPPSWMIIDTESEAEPSDVFHTEDTLVPENGYPADGDQTLPPLDVEASIAELATPETPQVPFAEDRFEMPGEEEPESEDDFGVVDLDSPPGVYSELHDLADQDEQAEAILREAAEAFGRSDPTTVEPIEEITQDLLEEPAPAPEDIDSYADALATQLGPEDTTIEPIEEVSDDLWEVEQADLVDSDAVPYLSEDELGEALAGLTDASPGDDLAEAVESVELTEPEEPITAGWWEAETPTTDEPDEKPDDLLEVEQAGLVDSDAVPYLSEDELGEALAGLTDASPGDDLTEPGESVETIESVELTEPEEPITAGWWEAETDATDDLTEPGESVETIESVELTGPEEPVAAPRWSADSPASDESVEPVESVVDEADIEAIGAVEWKEPTDDQDVSMDIDDANAVTQEATAVIDSSVEWGTRYREAHQGWVEDDEGRSTWRPIVTSGESVAGWDIDIYLGLVSGDISIEPASAEAVASEVAAAREGAVRRMLDEGLARGAHAIVGVTFSIQDVAGTVLVGASGVAVTLRTPA